MRQIEIPIILIVVDVSKKEVFWQSLQDNTEINKTLEAAIENNQDTATIHIPTSNTLPDKSDKLLEAVAANMNWLRANALSRMTQPIQDFIKKSPTERLHELREKTKLLNFHLFIEDFERLYSEGNYDELFSVAKDVLNSATEKIETRFYAGMYIERVYLQKIGSSSEAYQELSFTLHHHLLQILREGKGPSSLRKYTIFVLRSIILKLAVDQDFHYSQTSKITENDALVAWFIAEPRLQISYKASRYVLKVINLVNRIILSGDTLILNTFPRVDSTLSLFAHRLWLEGRTEQADMLYSWIKYCIDFCLSLAKATKQEDIFASFIIQNAYFRMEPEKAEKYIGESLELAKEIVDENRRNFILEAIDKLVNGNDKESSPEEELKFFRARARALGIDLDSPEDEISSIILQGLKDYNPERVLKDCEHLLVFPSRAQGIPARMVGLTSAATKWVHCLKFGYAMGGWRLDDIYGSPVADFGFKNRYCKNCEHKSPREENWKWSSKWHEEQMEKHKEIIVKIDDSMFS
jgi:hypothetical protein